MSDTICLTALLKQARIDLKAAQSEYEDTLRRFPLSDDDARIVDALCRDEVSIDDVYASSADVDNIAKVYHAKTKYERIRSVVDAFTKDPLSTEYRNADFNIPRRYYEHTIEAQAPLVKPAAQPNVKQPKRRPCRPDVIGYQFAIFILVAALFMSLITESPAHRELKNEMETAVDEAYREGYNDGYDEGSAGRYEEGYLDGYNDGYEYKASGGLWLPSERDALPSFSEWSDAKYGK